MKHVFGILKWVVVLLCITMGLHSCSCSDDNDHHGSNNSGTISGVLQDIDGNPIAGATIEIYDGGTLIATTTSGADGSYSVEVPAGSGYTILVTADGYTPIEMDMDDVVGNETMILDLEMDPDVGATGTVQGVVRNADDRSGIEGATIEIYDGEDLIATTTTDAGGNYAVTVAAGSGYTVRVTSTGFITADYNAVDVAEDETVILEAILQIADTYVGDGTIEGTITDAITGNGVDAVSITLRAGLNTRSGAAVASGSTEADGTYSIDVPTGYYTAQLTKAGYITAYISVISLGGETTGDQNASISPVLAAGETRIVLTWGADPEDLDSHLTGPTISGPRFHVYYSDDSISDGTVAGLDADDTTSYGPETITINTQISGTYYYYVNDYTNMDAGTNPSSELSNSGAQVKVYQSTGLVATFNIPANHEGTLWAVFSLNGTTITPINTFSYDDADAGPLP